MTETGPNLSFGRRILQGLAHRAFSGRVYDLSLGRGSAGAMTRMALPADPWSGNPARADRLFQGRYAFRGREVFSPQGVPWDGRPVGGESGARDIDVGDDWLIDLHGFDWLRHFRAITPGTGGSMAQSHARAMIQNWISHFARWEPLVWRPDVLARRLINWSRHADFLEAGADDAFRRSFALHFLRQARHLGRSAALTPEGAPRLVMLLGRIHVALVLRRNDRQRIEDELSALDAEIAAQILPDGGHASRSPAVLLGVLRDFIALRDMMDDLGIDCGSGLRHAIDRMAPMLRFFRHGDGGLALLHGSNEEHAADIDAVLLKSLAEGKPHLTAPHSGFVRAAMKRATLLFDTGLPARFALNAEAHCALLAIEFSYGRDRLITGCGENPRGGEWLRALASSAAHATLTIDQDDNCPADGRVTITRKREERDGHVWLEAEHDGYGRSQGVLHRRRIFLAASGEDLRGEDVLTPCGKVSDKSFAIRFHLHPDTQASLTKGGDGVLLRTASGHGWRFRAAGAALAVEDSVYFGSGGQFRRSRQIVLSGDLRPEALSVKWALTRVIPE